jgi:hypothetical protein
LNKKPFGYLIDCYYFSCEQATEQQSINPKGDNNMCKKTHTKQVKISRVEITTDKISGRGGLFFFLRYILNIGFFHFFERYFNFLKGTDKGLSCFQFTKQLFAHFMDGTDMSMTGFDRRKHDEGYAALLENRPEQMASSHQIKRMFRKFILVGNPIFRSLLLQLFIWRLRVEQPEVIILFGDTVVFDNDDAQKREGVNPTYKKKKGFQPLQISWGPYVVDALFRSGEVHSNHGTDFMKAVGRLVHAIRAKYRDVPIILLTDSGFMDDQNFRFFEERLKIHYICAGKLYENIKQYVQALPADNFSIYNQMWTYVEFANRLKSWSTFRRLIFTSLKTEEDGQMRFDFVRPDTVIYTNIGQDKELDEKLVRAGGAEYLNATKIIELNHLRGKGELVHRSQKEYSVKEQFPFERFGMNRAYYYFMLMSHFLYEAYKRDVSSDILSPVSYPNTFRRLMIDFAVKVVTKGGVMILKVSQTIYDTLNIRELWERIANQRPIFVT